jgi:FkbM family methyltransferase
MKQVNGVFVPDEETQMIPSLEQTGSWQLNHLDMALKYVRSMRVALDLGAHVGTWTTALATKFEYVMAFEPVPKTYACLLENIRYLTNVSASNCAVANVEGFWRWQYDDKWGSGNSGGCWLTRDKAGPVRALTIDQLEINNVDFMKVDVEGMEPLAFQGAVNTIRRCKPVILWERKPRFAKRYPGAPPAEHILTALGMKPLESAKADQIWGW